MHHLGYVAIAVGVLLGLAGGTLVWFGQELVRHPPAATGDVRLDPEPARLLRYLYELQTRYDLDKLVITKHGVLDKDLNHLANDVSIVQEFFHASATDEAQERAFHRLVGEIPVTYLKPFPDGYWDSTAAFAVTGEGRAYLRARE